MAKKKKKAKKQKTLLIWDVCSGVLRYEDLGMSDLGDGRVFLKLKLQRKKLIQEEYVAMNSLDEAMSMIRYFKSKIEPLEIYYG